MTAKLLILNLSWIILTLISCTASNQNEIVDIKFYRKDLIIHSGQNQITGLGVLPKQTSYQLIFSGRENPEIIRVANCHRDDVIKGDMDKRYSYLFEPTVIERSCLLQVTYLDEKGRHQFASVTFVDDETLAANIVCAGKSSSSAGVSTCQARVGTIQMINLFETVSAHIDASCPIESSDNQSFTYRVMPGICIYVFKNSSRQYHKLLVFGYNELIQGE